MDVDRNIEQREKLNSICREDAGARLAILQECAASLALWINLYGMTFWQQQALPDGRTVAVSGVESKQPAILWPVQEAALNELQGIEGGDVVWDKSREMGASWLIAYYMHWHWLFRPNWTGLWVSRKEELVDSKDNRDSLFWKHDYINDMLPDWMRPRIYRRHMHLGNLSNGSVISGESTNTDAARGGRRNLICVDEAAAIQQLDQILLATDQASPVRIFNSTPAGPGPFSKLRFSGRCKVIVLGWWNHPQKAVGRRQYTDEHGRIRWTSPWYEVQRASKSKREIAQNLDIDHMGAGAVFFDVDVLSRHKRDYGALPYVEGEIEYVGAPEFRDRAIASANVGKFAFRPFPGGRWRFWGMGNSGRLRAGHSYTIGVDIGLGMGSSDSAMSVFDCETGMKVGRFLDANTMADELARLAAMCGWWLGGVGESKCALIVPEANGEGGPFLRHLWKSLRYPAIYRGSGLTKKREKRGPSLGWTSNRQAKIDMLGTYRTALASDRFRNPDETALDQASAYVYGPTGGVMSGKEMEGSDGAEAPHGDMVIADGLAWLGASGRGRGAPAKIAPKPVAPMGTVEYWERKRIEDAKRRDEW